MLHYKGLITEEPGIKAKPIGDSDKDIMETLMFYDDELHEDSCDLVQKQLEEHFKLELKMFLCNFIIIKKIA